MWLRQSGVGEGGGSGTRGQLSAAWAGEPTRGTLPNTRTRAQGRNPHGLLDGLINSGGKDTGRGAWQGELFSTGRLAAALQTSRMNDGGQRVYGEAWGWERLYSWAFGRAGETQRLVSAPGFCSEEAAGRADF